MNATIEGLLLQAQAVDQTVPGIAGCLSSDQFNWSPGRGRWSVGQCVEHLNLTTERYLPVLHAAISDGRQRGLLGEGPLVLGFVERWILTSMEPPPKRRTRTRPSFVATGELSPGATVARWQQLQTSLAGCVRSAQGLDLRRVKVRSQFAPVSFSLGGTLSILLAHERRHLWQAREVRTAPDFPKGR